MRDVWVVWRIDAYGSDSEIREIEGVFATNKAAQAYLDTVDCDNNWYRIAAFTVKGARELKDA